MCVCSGVDSTMNSIKHVYGGTSRKGGGGGQSDKKKTTKKKGAVCGGIFLQSLVR